MGATLKDNLRLAVQAQRAEDARIRAKMDAMRMPQPCVRHEDPAPYGLPPEASTETTQDFRSTGTVHRNGPPEESTETVHRNGPPATSVHRNRTPEPDAGTVHRNGPPEESTGTVHRNETEVVPDAPRLLPEKDLIKTDKQRRLLSFLQANPEITTTHAYLSDALGQRKNTIRDNLNLFAAQGLISKSVVRVPGQGVAMQITFRSTGTVHRNGPPEESTETVHRNAPLKIDRLKTLSISLETVQLTWPNLARAGFGPEQYEQILDNLTAVGKATDRVTQGLDHIEFELANGQLVDKAGQPVADPCSWAFRALAQNGYYRRPKGYVSPEEQAERDAAAEAQALVQSREQARQARFQAWVKGLSAADRESALEGKQGTEEAWLKNVWRQRGEPE